MKRHIIERIFLAVALLCGGGGGVTTASAWDLSHLISGGIKAIKAATVSDDQIRDYVHQYIVYQDQQNKVAPANNPYTVRLMEITEGLTEVDGVPLNFKVYITPSVNAFACADGSVRVYSGLMDLMTDDEVLGVIGHEVGHVAHKDTKNAFKHALLTSAFLDGLGSTSDAVASLTDSQLGALTESVVSAKYSQKQESNADDYGYEFLKKSGKNPWAMALAFNKLMQIENSQGQASGAVSQLFSDHPSTQARIERMVKRCNKDHIAPPADAVQALTSQS